MGCVIRVRVVGAILAEQFEDQGRWTRNDRLIAVDDDTVRIRWRDYRHGNRHRMMALAADEFIRRFLLHVLPSGFVKIRHFGLLANRNRRQALALCRLHLSATTPDISELLNEQRKSALSRSCPQCKRGTLHVIRRYSTVELDTPNRTTLDSS